MSELNAQPPREKNDAAEAAGGEVLQNFIAEDPDEIAAAQAKAELIIDEDVLAGIEASNLRVIWRGGVPVEVLGTIGLAILIHMLLALTGWYYIFYWTPWTYVPKVVKDTGREVFVPGREDGGRAGQQQIGKVEPIRNDTPNNDAMVDPSIPLVETPEVLPEQTPTDHSAFSETDTAPRAIALGTGASGPRTISKGTRKAGGPGNETVTGTPGGDQIGDGGNGNSVGLGNGNGIDRGGSMDLEPTLLESPKRAPPEAYQTGMKQIARPPEVIVWVNRDNTVEKVELVKSSGDKQFDEWVMDYYRQSKYMAGTIDGEPARKAFPAAYGSRSN